MANEQTNQKNESPKPSVKETGLAPVRAQSDADFDVGDPVEHIGVEANGPKAAGPKAAGPIEPLAPTNAELEAGDGEPLTEAEVHEILMQRVTDYDHAVKDARAKQAEGAREEIDALKAFNAAKLELNAAFPPMTDAENRKQYIASENAKRAQRAGHGVPASRVDAAMGRSNSRGWRRPVRGVVGSDGSLMKNADGSVAMPRPMQARPVLPSQGTRTA